MMLLLVRAIVVIMIEHLIHPKAQQLNRRFLQFVLDKGGLLVTIPLVKK